MASANSLPRLKVILLVEDNPDDQLLAQRALGRSNLLNEIHTVSDGVEALEYLFGPARPSTPAVNHTRRDLPALVLLDLKLPRVDGIEVLRQIRAGERTRRLPVVILTSSLEEQDLIRGYDLGANAYVRKPIDFAEFAVAVQSIGMFWLLLNEPPPPVRPTSQDLK